MKHLDEILNSAYEVEEIFTGEVPARASRRGSLSHEGESFASDAVYKSSQAEPFSYHSDLEAIRTEIYSRVSGDIFHEQERAIAERIAEIWRHILNKHAFAGKHLASSLDAGDFLPSAVDLRRSDAFASGPIAVILYAHRYYLSRNASLHEVAAFLEASREMNLGPADVFASFARRKRDRSLLADLGILRSVPYVLTCFIRVVFRRKLFNLMPFRKGDLFRDKMILDLAYQSWGVSRK